MVAEEERGQNRAAQAGIGRMIDGCHFHRFRSAWRTLMHAFGAHCGRFVPSALFLQRREHVGSLTHRPPLLLPVFSWTSPFGPLLYSEMITWNLLYFGA